MEKSVPWLVENPYHIYHPYTLTSQPWSPLLPRSVVEFHGAEAVLFAALRKVHEAGQKRKGGVNTRLTNPWLMIFGVKIITKMLEKQ